MKNTARRSTPNETEANRFPQKEKGEKGMITEIHYGKNIGRKVLSGLISVAS